MFTPTPRQNDILGMARLNGRVNVEELAAKFDVTPQTIRKDLNDLCGQRLLTRTHGGAILASGVENVAYEARRHLADDEKRRIGEHAATLISNGSSLFINIGTTTEEVARALRAHEGLLVITNNIHVAGILLPSHDGAGADRHHRRRPSTAARHRARRGGPRAGRVPVRDRFRVTTSRSGRTSSREGSTGIGRPS
jgi:DeoR/GlpR family transcriptional regulator of sugar metabolism